jgi:hypothetical protein
MSAIKEKIQKLLAVAHDKGATEHEAATAMQMAMRLMTQHGISESEFKKIEKKARESAMFEADKRWMLWMANAAGRLYGCKYIRYSGGRESDKVTFVGREDNIDAAQLTYGWLCSQIETFYKQALPRGLSKSDRAEFRRTFKEACALRVFARVEALVKDMMANDAAASEALALPAPKTGTALAIISHRKELEDEVEQFFAEAGVRKSNRQVSIKSGSGSWAGNAAGNQVKLRQEVK